MRRLLAVALGILQADRDPVLVDYAPVPSEKPAGWREQKVAEARARHGRAFKCASPDQDREVLMAVSPDGRDVFRIVKAGHRPTAISIEPTPRLRKAAG